MPSAGYHLCARLNSSNASNRFQTIQTRQVDGDALEGGRPVPQALEEDETIEASLILFVGTRPWWSGLGLAKQVRTRTCARECMQEPRTHRHTHTHTHLCIPNPQVELIPLGLDLEVRLRAFEAQGYAVWVGLHAIAQGMKLPSALGL